MPLVSPSFVTSHFTSLGIMKNFISNLHHRHHPLQFSLIILCTLIFFSLLIGIIFYKYQNEWRWSTSIFYAINTLVGILYDVPQSKTNIADVFTLLFYIYGTFFLAGIIGAIVGTAIFHASLITSLEMRHLLNIPSNLNFNEKETSQSTRMESTDHRKKLLNFIPLMTTLIWLGIGGIFGVVFEGKSFGSSLYFALSTMSAACYANPKCEAQNQTYCDIGMWREIALTIYGLVGYPLFTILLSQFAALIVHRTVREMEIRILHSPLTEKEFHYVAKMYGNDEVMRLSEFTILELLRLHRVTIDDLDLIKILFKQIDTCEGGNIDKLMLAKAKLMRGYGSISESSHHNVVDFSKFSPNLQTPPYSPMVQLEPDFLQIMNQRDMENQLSPTSEQQISPSWKEWNEGSFPSPVGLRRMTYDQYHETIVRPIIDYQEYQITSSRGNSEFSMTFASPIRDFLLTMTNESPRDSNDD